MPTVKKSMQVIGIGCAIAGLVLAAAGFALSGFNPCVFTSKIDQGSIVLGGLDVENPESLPLLGAIASNL